MLSLHSSKLYRPFLLIAICCSLVALLPLIIPGVLYVPSSIDFLTSGGYFSKHFLKGFFNTCLISLSVSSAACLFGTIQAFILARFRLAGKTFWSSIYLLPLVIPPYIHTLAWIRLDTILKTSNLEILNNLGMLLHPALYSLAGVIFILTIISVPLVTLIVYQGLVSIPVNQDNAALVFTSPIRVLRKIDLPLILPHLGAAFLIVFILSMNIFDVPDILRVHTIPAEVFMQLSAFYSESNAFSAALPSTFVAFAVTFIFQVLSPKMMTGRDLTGSNMNFTVSSTTANITGTSFLVMLLAVSTMIPLLTIAGSAALADNKVEVILSSSGQIGYSFILGGGVAATVTIVAIPFGYLLARFTLWKTILEPLILLFFIIPVALYSLSFLRVISWLPDNFLLSGSLPCIIGLTIHFLFVGVKILQAGFYNINEKNEEAAAFYPKAWFRVFGSILFPQLIPYLIFCFALIFIFVIGELSATLLLVPPGQETIAVKIYNLMHYGAYDQVMILCLLMSCIILILYLILNTVSKCLIISK